MSAFVFIIASLVLVAVGLVTWPLAKLAARADRWVWRRAIELKNAAEDRRKKQ